MFFSFVGLMLAVVWASALAAERWVPAVTRAKLRPVMAVAAVLVLAGYAYGVHVRNDVWHTEDSLWQDDAIKSPHNGRGLMIFGLTQMNRGDYVDALNTFTQALLYTPNYPTLEINLGVVNGILADKGDASKTADAERHYQRAIALDENSDAAHAYYGRWLEQHGRFAEGIAELRQAIALDPPRPFQHDVLMEALLRSGDAAGAKQAALDTLAVNPNDAEAQQILTHPAVQDEAFWINASLAQSKAGQNEASIESAKKALVINPNSADAYVNIGAGYGAMGQWDQAIASEREAIRIRPDYQLAKNNLAWYTQEKASGVKITAPVETADEYVNDSLHLAQAARYDESIAAAKKALAMNPNLAAAWNNIAADYEAEHKWDEAIAAAQKAIALQPDFQLAKNNLAWSQQQKAAGK
jgi:tetratricopeptide (TPR) repeat protein